VSHSTRVRNEKRLGQCTLCTDQEKQGRMRTQSNLKLHKGHMKVSKTLRVAVYHLLAAQGSFTQGGKQFF